MNIQTYIKNKIYFIELSRKRVMNALNIELLKELESAIDNLPEELLGVVISGCGEKAFCAGADIKFMCNSSVEECVNFAKFAQDVFSKIENLPIPVIAAVDGIAFGGGCELAMACDFIYATKNSFLGQPEVKIGVIPCFGGLVRLSTFVGMAKAKEMIFTGRSYSAKQAKSFGLVNEIFSTKEELLDEIYSFFSDIDKCSLYALGICKNALNKNQTFEAERLGFSIALDSGNGRKGLESFVNKNNVMFTNEYYLGEIK